MRVALCLPSKGEPKAGFSYDLARLCFASGKAGLDLTFTRGTGTLIHDTRNDIAERALKHDPNYLFWLDDDMRFPVDALDRLLRSGFPIVGCNYPTRSKGNSKPTARRLLDDGRWEHVYTTPLSEGYEELDALGFGCLLMDAKVFKDLPTPWFSMPWDPRFSKHVGEDVYFCVNAGQRGFPTVLDHELSKELKHGGYYEYEWADINRHRG